MLRGTVPHVSGPHVSGPHGPVPVRIHEPQDTARAARAGLVWAHGGGFRHGDLDMPEADMVAAELCRRAGVTVVSVGYRLAVGGVRYPVPVDDVDAVWQWACAQGFADRVGIGGASAGAALAMSTALRARDAGRRTPDLLLLAYPFVHYPVPGAAGYDDMVHNYVGRLTDLPPDALPGGAPLEGLPATHVLLSEFDDLRASGELLAHQLREAKVPVTTYLARGATHGHLNRPADHPDAVDESLNYFAGALRTMLQ
ncbi:alpha/beta hydrolase fold domain-containing protein [Winogradskya consettensis]|uniref:Esterase n=2 Tax=Winogradskya consettensis TaxID=113560 RepID=A0A919SMM8_9ACTN|nr:esterase [Actinoplanes consettensis]